MKILKIIGIVLLSLVVVAVGVYYLFLKPPPPPISEADRAELKMIPLPANLSFSDGILELSGSISVEKPVDDPRLSRALKRFADHFDLAYSDAATTELNLVVTHHDSRKFPSVEADETYELEISNDRIEIKSGSIWGAMHGLESVKQLATGNQLQQCTIKDTPRFPWRGLMIDVSRHWIPKSVILQNLEAMAQVKLNVLHLHLSDYQGFRVESKVFPKLHELGSSGNYYTQEDLREIVEFAADRGIRVVPEFDVPGHATSWFTGYPELASQPGPYTIDTVLIGVFRPIMDPTKEEVYDFLSEFFREMAALFPDPYFHIGGDEANYSDWQNNSAIQSFMAEKNIKDEHALQAYFNGRLQEILGPIDRVMVGWDEILNEDLPKSGILTQVWRNQSSLWESARMGYPTILSAGWYLDHKRTSAEHYGVDPLVIKGGVTIEIDSANWESWELTITFNESEFQSELYLFGLDSQPRGVMMMMGAPPTSIETVETSEGTYRFDLTVDIGTIAWELTPRQEEISGKASLGIINLDVEGTQSGSARAGTTLPEFKKIEPLTDEQQALILGGETCMWTEMVDSVTINSRIWPRAAAIAERLWSSTEVANDPHDMYRRLIAFDTRLKDSPINPYEGIDQIGMNLAPRGLQAEFVQLLGVLEEDKMFNRMLLYPESVITRSIQLERLVDAARAESYPAYHFGTLVEQWSARTDTETKKQLEALMQSWYDSQSRLLEELPPDSEAFGHAQHLRELSRLGLTVVNGSATDAQREALRGLASSASQASSGVVLAVAPHFEKLAAPI